LYSASQISALSRTFRSDQNAADKRPGSPSHTCWRQPSAQHCRKIDIDESSSSCAVPDPKLTPGEMDASLARVSNRDRPRNFSDSEKNAIQAACGDPASTKKSSCELDDWLPYWMGGSDTAKNTWFEPHAGKFGSLGKDKVQLLLSRNVCVNKTMTLGQAKVAT
jgi:hypothetical protein